MQGRESFHRQREYKAVKGWRSFAALQRLCYLVLHGQDDSASTVILIPTKFYPSDPDSHHPSIHAPIVIFKCPGCLSPTYLCHLVKNLSLLSSEEHSSRWSSMHAFFPLGTHAMQFFFF